MVEAPKKNPCPSCPYRKDVPSGVWSESEYRKLPEYDGPTGDQNPLVFCCHLENKCLCSGWVGCHDMEENLALRLAVIDGSISVENVEKIRDYVSPVPLWGSGKEAMDHGLREVDSPGLDAQKLISKFYKKKYDENTNVFIERVFTTLGISDQKEKKFCPWCNKEDGFPEEEKCICEEFCGAFFCIVPPEDENEENSFDDGNRDHG